MNKTSKHVVPNPTGGWAVKNYGATRASRTFGTQAEAMRYGRSAAIKDHAELYVHARDGTIRNKKSYDTGPLPPRNGK